MKNLFFTVLLSTWSFSSVFANHEDGKLEIELLSDNVYRHVSYHQVDGYGLVASNGLIVINKKQAFLIDTPWSEKDTAKLFNWVKQKGYQLASSISTHSHADRTAGIEFLNQKAVNTYTSELTYKLLNEQQKTLPNSTFEGDRFSLSKDLIEVSFHGQGHTPDNLVVWLPQSKILFGGCLVRSANSKTLGYIGEASIEQWSSTIASLQSEFIDVKYVVPGHGQYGGWELLENTKHLATLAKKQLNNTSNKK